MMTNLASIIRGVLEVDPAASELEYNEKWLNWGDLERRAVALDEVLNDLGLGAGARVGVMLRNRPEMVSVLLAVFMSERCLATLNAGAPADKLAEDVRKVAAPVILGLPEDWEKPGILEAARENGAFCIELNLDSVRIIATGSRLRWTNSEAPGIAIEMLSSGTTGTPKRIPLKARNFEKALMGAASYEKGRSLDDAPKLRRGVQIVTAPLAHIAGITGVMNNILAGRRICLIDKFDVEAFRSAIVRHGPKVAGAPPSALRMILDADVPKKDLSSLVAFRTGTAPLDPDLADEFYNKYGIPVLQNYGATEFAGGVAGWTLEDFKAHWGNKRGSVGRLNSGAEAHTVDPETGAVLPSGETGLLAVRAPNIGDGITWVRTTDIARVDEDRFVWILGRHDNAIIRGGFKILPDDLVRILEQYPDVREATVIGVPDRRLGQVPVAAVIRRTGKDLSIDKLMEFLRKNLMNYQVPVRIIELKEFPRTPSMKVSQPALQALFENAEEGREHAGG